MEINKTQEMETTTQKIQLVQGEFTPSQASDIITSLIDKKINFHKVEGLQLWEGNNKADQSPVQNRIEELENDKKIAKKFISQMRSEGKKLKIDGVLTITKTD